MGRIGAVQSIQQQKRLINPLFKRKPGQLQAPQRGASEQALEDVNIFIGRGEVV